MGRRGPKPQSAAVKIKKGNPGNRPVGVDPPITLAPGFALAVQPPGWLRKGGLEVWKRLAPRLVTLKLLTPADTETFARYCRNFARWLKMQTELDRQGETYEADTANGRLKRANPAYLVADRLERQLLASEDRFGLNPAERQRLFAARATHADPAAGDLFSERRGDRRPDDPASQPAVPEHDGPAPSPVGLGRTLN